MHFVLKLFLGAWLGILLLPYLVVPQLTMPLGCDENSPYFSYTSVNLLVDRTYWDETNKEVRTDHEILKALMEEIQSAETFLMVDFFLWNDWKGRLGKEHSLDALSLRLADAILEKRKQNPEMPILVLTDQINRLYGSNTPEFFQRFVARGIPVVFTDLKQLPDPNPLYSKQVRFWSKFYSFKPPSDGFRIFPNLVESKGQRLSLSQFLSAFHLKGNHRKVLVAGYKNKPSRTILGSFNPSDGSALNQNLAVSVDGPVADYIARSEMAIAEWSASDSSNLMGKRFELEDALRRMDFALLKANDFEQYAVRKTGVRFVSEGSIGEAVMELLEDSKRGTEIDIALFHLSDRSIVKALKQAAKRGVKLRILLDQNNRAFGYKKMGVPNRSVADELMTLDEVDSIQIHWASSATGGQYHTKAMRVFDQDRDILLLGSANFTHRSLFNYNLEANLLFNQVLPVNNAFDHYFDSLWNNSTGFNESLEYKALKNPEWMQFIRKVFYFFREWTQLSTY